MLRAWPYILDVLSNRYAQCTGFHPKGGISQTQKETYVSDPKGDIFRRSNHLRDSQTALEPNLAEKPEEYTPAGGQSRRHGGRKRARPALRFSDTEDEEVREEK